jgi:hypothetical protein
MVVKKTLFYSLYLSVMDIFLYKLVIGINHGVFYLTNREKKNHYITTSGWGYNDQQSSPSETGLRDT